MAETMAPDFVTPPKGVRRLPVTSIVPTGRPLDEGIKLFLNQDGYGYILEKESEGLWLSPVENTTVPSARGGSSLRNRRWAEGDSFLVLSLHSPSPEYMYDMFARLVSVVTSQSDYFDLVVFDPYSQEARRRTFLYEDGLENLNEVTGTYHTVGVTAKFLSPFWRGPERVVTERIAPPVKPLITADPGRPVDRWPDPDFSDTAAYAPWFVVDGGLEKNGTGDDHGVFVGSHRVEVSPGETVSVSADLSYVDGPNVGDIQIRMRAYDVDGDLIDDSEQTVISESYGGTYTSTYDVPETGVEIELGFYTDADVHANTRVRVDNLNVQREVQYLARYEWEGEPHNTPSIKRDHTGKIVARNLFTDPQPSSQDSIRGLRGTLTPLYPGFRLTASGESGQVRIDTGNGGGGHPLNPSVSPGQYVALGVDIRSPDEGSIYASILGFTGTSYLDIVRGPLFSGADWSRQSIVIQASGGIDNVLARVRFDSLSVTTGSRIDLRNIGFAVADTEAEALEQVETYFDGDTPDVVDEVSREGSYSFPFFPVFLSDSTVQGGHELRVEGDAPVWPIWEIQGPGRDVEIIGPDGSRLFVEGEVTSPITIVTEPRKRSIRDDSGLIWERMKPGDDQFFALEPGDQVVKMTMVGGNPESTIKAVYSENWKTPRGTAQGMIRGGAA